MERSAVERPLQCVSFRTHSGIDCVLRDARLCQLENRPWVSGDPNPHRLFTDVRRRPSFIGCGWRCVDRSGRGVFCGATFPATNRNSRFEIRKLNWRGGGGIRTHEGLRPAGFQDRSHQPLDHPSLPNRRENCAIATASGKVDRALRGSDFCSRRPVGDAGRKHCGSNFSPRFAQRSGYRRSARQRDMFM